MQQLLFWNILNAFLGVALEILVMNWGEEMVQVCPLCRGGMRLGPGKGKMSRKAFSLLWHWFLG